MGTTDGNSCIKYSNRENGREKTPPVSVPVPADFFLFFFLVLVFLPKWYTVGFYGIRCRSGRDFPVPFSTLLLGAYVQDPEVWGEFHGGISTEKSRWSKAYQRCSIDREENNDIPQTGAELRRSIGGALTDALVVGHLY